MTNDTRVNEPIFEVGDFIIIKMLTKWNRNVAVGKILDITESAYMVEMINYSHKNSTRVPFLFNRSLIKILPENVENTIKSLKILY